MARPALPLGTFGAIACKQVAPSKYKARARFRNLNGTTDYVARFGQTKTEAKNLLSEALRDLQQSGGRITGTDRVDAVARRWLETVEADKGKATKTRELYAYAVDRYVVPYFGKLQVRELSAGAADRGLKRITAAHGPSAAKTARAALNGAVRLAVLHGALSTNPVRDADPVTVCRKRARSLTLEQEQALTDRLRTIPRAMPPGVDNPPGLDLADLVDWMLATGCRIGEALAVRDGVNEDGEPLLDLEGGTWEVDATVIRVKGDGLVVQARPKSAAGRRRIAVPEFGIAMMRDRRAQLRLQPATVRVLRDDGGIVEHPNLWVGFPSPTGRDLRDSSNTQGDLRDVLDRIDHPDPCMACGGGLWLLDDRGGFVLERGRRVRCKAGPWSWVTSHTFRKTVATRLYKAGLDDGAVADHLGHEDPSMTRGSYLGRQVAAPEAAKVLER